MTSPSAPTSRAVRVFISSTFRDFGAERDLLMKRVLPERRRRARERFVDVAFIDLQWGITEEQSRSGQTLPICLREIEAARPYFVGLLGDRYGWTPHAEHYPNRLLEAEPWLKEHVGGKSVTELEILHGVLNNPVTADLLFVGGLVKGSYVYDRISTPIPIEGSIGDGYLSLPEFLIGNQPNAQWSLTWALENGVLKLQEYWSEALENNPVTLTGTLP